MLRIKKVFIAAFFSKVIRFRITKRCAQDTVANREYYSHKAINKSLSPDDAVAEGDHQPVQGGDRTLRGASAP